MAKSKSPPASPDQNPVSLLEEIKQLLELKGENAFKIRAYDQAIKNLQSRTDLLDRAKSGTLTEIAGIGKGLAEVLTEFFLKGTSSARDELRASLPEGLMELTQVPGLGPKKAIRLIEQLGIRSLAELEYACKENRLLKLKGFGEKLQLSLLKSIALLKQHEGQIRIDQAWTQFQSWIQPLRELCKPSRVEETGAFRRRCETLSRFELLVESQGAQHDQRMEKKIQEFISGYAADSASAIPVEVHFASADQWGYELARTSSAPAFWKALGTPASMEASSEEDFFKRSKVPWIYAEARESSEALELAKKGQLEQVLPEGGILGVFHNHTTRSDGAASLEEMVRAAEKLGYRYIGISDHSQSAHYASGLKPEDLEEQYREIEKVREKHPGIRVFWGIESDILADGSLDYDLKALKKFDFVIASVHSRFKMDRAQMTERVLKAVRHPCTRFLGHATGRLLLGRPAYDIDLEAVIQEAAACDVAIELNANPARLDIDWRWGPSLRSAKTKISINPDAHDVEGLEDVRYGVMMARKALIPAQQVVNAEEVQKVSQWLARK